MATQPGQITVANSGGTTNPANFTANSFVSTNTGAGANAVTIDVSGTWSQTVGLLVLFVPNVPNQSYAPTIRTIPQSSLVAKSNGNTSGITTGVSDSFDLGINGAGTLYVIAGSGAFTGPADITISQGLGPPSKSPGSGDQVDATIVGPTGAHGAVAIEGVASGTPIPVSAASLPLPTGAATAANQAVIITTEQEIVMYQLGPQQIDYQGGTNAVYIGYSTASGNSTGSSVFQIVYLTYGSSGLTVKSYYNGTGSLATAWASRTTYTYTQS